MAGKNTAVFGIYPNRSGIEYALSVLKDTGFRNTDVSVFTPGESGNQGPGHRKSDESPRGSSGGRRFRRSNWRCVGMARGPGSTCNTRSRPIYRGGTDRSCTRGHWRRRSSGRIHGRPDRHGNSGVRGEALRRTHQVWRHLAFHPLWTAASGPKKQRKFLLPRVPMTFRPRAKPPRILAKRIAQCRAEWASRKTTPQGALLFCRGAGEPPRWAPYNSRVQKMLAEAPASQNAQRA